MKHGTKWTYSHYKCRCNKCKDANNESHHKYRLSIKNNTIIPRPKRLNPSILRAPARIKLYRDNINTLKANTPCADCGDIFPAVCMDFDHRDPTTKSFTISQGLSNLPTTIMTEMAKCDIVCSNCHRIRTFST